MNWIPIEDLFKHVPCETGQHKVLFCLAGTAWTAYGAITVFAGSDPVVVSYSEFVDDSLVFTYYIPTHFILIPERPLGPAKLVRQEDS